MSKAWDGIAEDVIRQSFILCGITAAMDGSEDSNMCSHVPRDLADEVTIPEEDEEEEESRQGEEEEENMMIL